MMMGWFMRDLINWHDHFYYEPDTGKIRWKYSPRHSINAGDEAGSPSKRGYICIVVRGVSYRANRIAWEMYNNDRLGPDDEVDHINHIPDDNRACNLRKVSRTDNNRNASRRKDNKSGLTGVHWNARADKWKAGIFVDGKLIFLGHHDNIFDAACARKSAIVRYGFHENHGG